MSNNKVTKVTKEEILNRIVEKYEERENKTISRADVLRVYSAIEDVIKDLLNDKATFKIFDAFNIKVVHKEAYTKKCSFNGVGEVDIPAHDVVKVQIASNIKELVSGIAAKKSTTKDKEVDTNNSGVTK